MWAGELVGGVRNRWWVGVSTGRWPVAGDAHGLDKDSGCLKVRLLEGHSAVRVTTVFNMLLSLSGVNVTGVSFESGRVVVDVRLRRRRLVCPRCGWSTRWRYDTQPHPSTWRALDLGVWRVVVRATLRWLRCRPCRRVVVEAVDFARMARGSPATSRIWCSSLSVQSPPEPSSLAG